MKKTGLAWILVLGLLLGGCRQETQAPTEVFSVRQMNQQLLDASAGLPRSELLYFHQQ